MSDDQGLKGITLRIYVTLANADKPLGPREITRIANLSSPSVAYRNLQKLEELGLIEKDAFGEYIVKQRQKVKGHFWVGEHLFARPLFYAFFFIGILSMEVSIAVVKLLSKSAFSYDFILLLLVTAISTGIFLLEGTSPKIFEHKK